MDRKIKKDVFNLYSPLKFDAGQGPIREILPAYELLGDCFALSVSDKLLQHEQLELLL